MSRRLPAIPPSVAKAFLKDMRAFFKAKGHKADEIAARQMSILREYQGPGEKPITLLDVKEMFREMREEEG